MKHTSLSQLKRVWLTTLLSGVCSGEIMAAETPAIHSSTLAMHLDGTISFQFEAAAGETGFQLQSAAELGNAAAWRIESQAAITEPVQGLYQVILRPNEQRRVSFYRIAASNAAVAPLFINEVMSRNVSKIADAQGAYWDWVEIFNPGDTAVDLRGYGLSDDEALPHQWQFPSTLIQPGSFVLVFASGLETNTLGGELHAGFKLDADGEPLFLTAPDGRMVDQIQIPALQTNQSVGRLPDGSERLHVYAKDQATPRAPNVVTSLGPLIEPPRFSIDDRFFLQGATQTVGLQPAVAGQTIRYTTNGSPVTSTSVTYTAALLLNRTTVVRAMAFEGSRFSAEAAGTFFFGAEHQLPVISLAALPSHFEFRNGFLYGMGSQVLSSSGQVLQNFPFSGSHAWLDREVEVSLEFYEPNHELGFQLRAGLKIFGGWGSRGYPQKSFSLFARQKYGDGKINYQVFPDKEIDGFETLVLRNSGNDNQSTHQTPPRPPITAFGTNQSYGSYFVNSSFTLMRDAMMQRLIKDTDLDLQAYRPAILYINGDYWGIYNLREKMNDHYVISNHGVEKGQIDLIEGYGTVQAGDATVYQAMRNYINTRDLRQSTNYAFVEQNYLDIDNFIDYHLAVIYFQNFDIGNIKCWRPRVPKGRFRWMVYDQDYGFNLWKPEVYLPAMARDYADYDNMFRFYTAGSGTGTGWPNQGGRTLLLRRLLMNDSFKQRFIRRCADLLNGPFREETVVRTIQEMAAVIRPEMARHLQRWSWTELQARGFGRPHQPEYQSFTRPTWETNIQVLLDFARKRPAKLRQDCIQHFGLSNGLAEVTVNVEPFGSGRVQFNSVVLTNFPWSGIAFRHYPVTVTAIPKPGYRFIEWTGAATTTNQPRWELTLSAATNNLAAQFEPFNQSPLPAPAVIASEIQYHPASDQESGDWVELHNRGSETVHLAGWILRDDDDNHDFLLPEVSLPAGGYVVLCQDAAKFSRIYPTVTNYVGDFVFGLGNGGDAIRLFDPTGILMLSIQYSDEAPWPPEADGTGRTLQLINPISYSPNPSAWTFSPNLGGTPGKANP